MFIFVQQSLGKTAKMRPLIITNANVHIQLHSKKHHYITSPVPIPVSAAGLVTVLYWFCVEMILDLGLRAGDESRESSSMMLLLRGCFLGNSLRRCSKEYRNRSSFWLDSLKRAWAWIKEGGKNKGREGGVNELEKDEKKRKTNTNYILVLREQ